MFKFDDKKNYPVQTKSRMKIRFQDCDPLQHLNNAKYFDYYFNARDDQVPKLYNVEMADIFLSYKAAWVVYNHQINYLRPAIIGEWVKIYSSIIWFDIDTVVVEYYMTDDKESHLKNILWSKLKFVDVKNGRKLSHPKEIIKFLESTTAKDVEYGTISIIDRIKKIKEKL